MLADELESGASEHNAQYPDIHSTRAEAATGYDVRGGWCTARVSAIGMVLAHEFSARMNLASPDDAARVERHLREVGLPTRMSDIEGELPPTDILMKHIAQDKKVRRGALTFILTHGVGRCFVSDHVPGDEVFRFLEEKRAT